MTKLVFEAVKKGDGRSIRGINISYGDRGKIHFSPRPLSDGTISDPDVFLSSVNNLLLNFTEDDHRALWDVYSEIKDVYETPQTTITEIIRLETARDKFFDVINAERLQAWARDYSGYTTATSVDEISPRTDGGVSNSCNQDQYRDICVLSTLFKLLIPFLEVNQVIVVSYEKEICDFLSLFRMLDSHGHISDFPGYIYLIGKTKEIAIEELGNAIPTGLTAAGVSEDEYYEIILVPKLFRDVTRLETEVLTFGPEKTNNNISFKISLSLRNRVKNDIMRHYSYRNTRGDFGGDDDGNTTLKERIAGGESYSSLYGMILTKEYEEILDVIEVSDIPYKLTKEEVDTIESNLDGFEALSEIHKRIIGVMFDQAIYIDANIYCSKHAGNVMRVYAAMVLDKFNLPNLRAMMLSDLTQGAITETIGRAQMPATPVTHNLYSEVLALYENEPKGNPVTQELDLIVTHLSRNLYIVKRDVGQYPMGSEWEPTIINGWGIKDEIIELLARIYGVYP